jgi:hypothetical protein
MKRYIIDHPFESQLRENPCGNLLRYEDVIDEIRNLQDAKNRAPLLAMEIQQEKMMEEMVIDLVNISKSNISITVRGSTLTEIVKKLIELGWRKQ